MHMISNHWKAESHLNGDQVRSINWSIQTWGGGVTGLVYYAKRFGFNELRRRDVEQEGMGTVGMEREGIESVKKY